MTKKNVKKNTATTNAVDTETAVKPDVVSTPSGTMFPVFPTKLCAKTEEFCNEFNTIQLLKKRKMTITHKIRKDLLEAEINVRKNLLGIFRLQVNHLLNDACEKVDKELA